MSIGLELLTKSPNVEWTWWWGRWGNKPELHSKSLCYYLKATGNKVTKITTSNTLRRSGLKSCSACKVPLPKRKHVQARLNFAIEHLDDSEEGWEKVLWAEKKLTGTPRTPSQPLSMVVETLCFGAVSLLRRQNDYIGSRKRWMRLKYREICLNQDTEDGPWLVIPAWQWPKAYS